MSAASPWWRGMCQGAELPARARSGADPRLYPYPRRVLRTSRQRRERATVVATSGGNSELPTLDAVRAGVNRRGVRAWVLNARVGCCLQAASEARESSPSPRVLALALGMSSCAGVRHPVMAWRSPFGMTAR